jgi:hypothetical protein
MLIYILTAMMLGEDAGTHIFTGAVFGDINNCEDVARVLMEDQTVPRLVFCVAYKPLNEV